MRRIILFFASVAAMGCGNSGDFRAPNDVQAENMAHNVIKAALVDPDADFLDETAKMTAYRDSSYVFTGDVRALDKAGEKMSMKYNVGIKWKGGNPLQDSSWTVKFCNIKPSL